MRTRLSQIQAEAQRVAEAIAMALGIEVEIVDEQLTVVAGTGPYRQVIGRREEHGRTDALYGRVLASGRGFAVDAPEQYGPFGPSLLSTELAEVGYPIMAGGQPVGVLALVAFEPQQLLALHRAKDEYMHFVQQMAELLAAKVRTEESIRELEVANLRFEAMMESIRDGILAVDADGVITQLNAAAEALLGVRRSEWLGRRMADLWPDLRPDLLLARGTGYTNRQVTFQRADGQPVFLLVSAAPLRLGDSVFGLLLTLSDAGEVVSLAASISRSERGDPLGDLKGDLAVLKDQIIRVAASSATVLITGESGTGKDLVARAIHAASPRSAGPFITVNCGAIPESLLESELFGYEEGAFTGARRHGKPGKFEQAQGGTLFLDEVAELPLHLQVKLLTVLQNRRVVRLGGTREISLNARIIAATNRDLESMVASGQFRADLFFRLSVIPLHVPPLRERRHDIPELTQHFVSLFARRLGKQVRRLHPDVELAFAEYSWPGNVRELENALEYAVHMATGPVIMPGDLPPRLHRAAGYRPGPALGGVVAGTPASPPLAASRAQSERAALERELERWGRDVAGKRAAAKALGISLATLYRKLRKYGLT